MVYMIKWGHQNGNETVVPGSLDYRTVGCSLEANAMGAAAEGLHGTPLPNGQDRGKLARGDCGRETEV